MTKRKNTTTTASAGAPARPKRTPLRGWLGKGRGNAGYVQPPTEWRGTSVQVCGLWPFAVGAGTPMVGVPLGRNLLTGATLCCDPISWFQRARLIANPSAFILGKPGLGKSSIAQRMMVGGAGYGVIPFVLGDEKPDYIETVQALGGQVITLGHGRGSLNVLDPGEALEAAKRLPEAQRAAVLADAHQRRTTMVSALLSILRSAEGTMVTGREEQIIDAAIRHLDAHHDGIPVLGDLLRVIQEGPASVRAVALDRGDDVRYQSVTENLESNLIGLISGGTMGELFAHQTTNPMRRDRAVVFDLSSLKDAPEAVRGAALLACWSTGFGTINVATALADAGLEPRRHYLVVMDELWKALRAGRGIVDRVDSLTRLNRQYGVGQIMISHTMSDLMALSSPEDRAKARGLVERSGMVICGGLPEAEMPLLTSAVKFSRAEQDMMIGWQDPAAWDPTTGTSTTPPGLGKFLVKVGGRPGIPFRSELTTAELAAHDTNRLWIDRSRIGSEEGQAA